MALFRAGVEGLLAGWRSLRLAILLLIRDHLHRLRGSQHGQLLRVHVYVNVHCLVMTRVVVERLARRLLLLTIRCHLNRLIETPQPRGALLITFLVVGSRVQV